ncbi:MAG: 5' nucleotidase, NT5C type [Anaerostipes caccae]|jgi:guanylate kinase
MRKKLKPLILLDVDDVLFECNSYAVTLANSEYHFDPPLSIQEIKKWGKSGGRIDVIHQYFQRESFFKHQPVMNGAYEFLKELCKKADVIIATAVPMEFMGIRTERILNEFPFFQKENLVMCQRKDLIRADIAFDDGMHNILESGATYPVLLRKPWNQEMTGSLAVNNYREFLALLEHITHTPSQPLEDFIGSKIYCLIGPTGSGKNAFAEYLNSYCGVERVVSYTTRTKRPDDIHGRYRFLTKKQFQALEAEDFFYETTSYGGEKYGTSKDFIDRALSKGDLVMPVDICGAVALQAQYPEQTVLVYIKKPRKEIVQKILKLQMPNEEKAIRLLSIDHEKINQQLCDLILENHEDYCQMAARILKHDLELG